MNTDSNTLSKKIQQIAFNKVEFILAMKGQLDTRKPSQFKMMHQQKTAELAMMISNNTGKAFLKIINQFLLQTSRAPGKIKSIYHEEQQIFTNDREKGLSSSSPQQL